MRCWSCLLSNHELESGANSRLFNNPKSRVNTQRFTTAELTDVPFRRPPNYDFEKVMNQGFGVWTQKKFRAVLDLTGWAASFARERQWSPGQEFKTKGDVTRLSFWATSEPEVAALAMSFGGCAEVIEP